MSDFAVPGSASRLDKVLHDLLRRAPELQAAAVVSFDGLPMASALPYGFDEDRVAAMSAALLSLGERASQGLGRGSLNQVYIEGEEGTVFLVSADDEAVLVAVGAHGAKVGLLLFEVRRGAQAVAETLRQEDPPEVAGYAGHDVSPLPVHVAGHDPEPEPLPEPLPELAYVAPVLAPVEAIEDEIHAASPAPAAHTPSYSNLPDAPAYPIYDGSTADDDVDDEELVPVADLVPVDAYVADEPGYEAAPGAEGAPAPSSHLGSWASFTPGGSLSAHGQGLDPWL